MSFTNYQTTKVSKSITANESKMLAKIEITSDYTWFWKVKGCLGGLFTSIKTPSVFLGRHFSYTPRFWQLVKLFRLARGICHQTRQTCDRFPNSRHRSSLNSWMKLTEIQSRLIGIRAGSIYQPNDPSPWLLLKKAKVDSSIWSPYPFEFLRLTCNV